MPNNNVVHPPFIQSQQGKLSHNCYDFKQLENRQQSNSKSHLFRGLLKNASYPTSIVFKGLRKSRVEEELSIKD